MKLFHRCALVLVGLSTSLASTSCQAVPETPNPQVAAQWKTAYYKRGFVGKYLAGWADGIDSTLRTRLTIPFDGTSVRVTLMPIRDAETDLSKITIAPGKYDDTTGTLTGPPAGLSFGGAPNTTIAANAADVVSDATQVPIRRGVWYLQQSYASPTYLYAYSADGFFNQAGEHHDATTLDTFRLGAWPGNVYRVEVLTADTRPIILCYGDSITAGYLSTPETGSPYPEVLSKLTNLPTLNLGVNGDMIQYTGGVPSLVKSCNGVQTVVVLMGINDIIRGDIKTTAQYSKIASNLIASLKNDHKRVFWGTITPAEGNKDFDKDPDKEVLRQSINSWIRKESGADAILDFDAALADPAHPSRMKAEDQSDWLHPNDAGYRLMAEVAAKYFPAVR